MYCAIDPSVHATAVVWKTTLGNLWEGCCCPIADWLDIKYHLEIAKKQGVTVAVIERSMNFGPSARTQDQLAEARGRVVQMCRELGLEVVYIVPATWQGPMLGKLPRGGKTSKERTANRKARKAASIRVARDLGADDALLGMEGQEDDNVADAVCIAAYAALNELREEAA